jgi:sugar phosphate isomerase/epimerase
MKHPGSRRTFLKTMATIPAVTALGVFTGTLNAAITKEGHSHKFKLSLNLYSFNALLQKGEVDLFDMLDFCAKYNFDAIDPTGYYFPNYPKVPSDEFINDFKRKAFLLGLDISGTGVRNDFANPDAAKRKEDVEMIKKWIEAAAKLGIPNLRIFAGTSKHEGFSRDQVFEWMTNDIRECCEHGKKFGIVVAIQNHNDFLKTADDVDRIFEMVGSEWLGLNLDIGSYRMKGPYQEIEQNIKHAVTWQIKENVWTDGKETPTDFEQLFRIIKKAGYRGYLPLETLGAGDPYEKVPRLLERAQTALDQI